jgi:hypothetical protein
VFSAALHLYLSIYIYLYLSIYLSQGWELTRLVHELVQQGRELSRESVQLNSGFRAQDRFNKVQHNKDLMIREPYWTTNEPTQNQANSGKLV